MNKTYLNRNNTPIIRKCGNCTNFRPMDKGDGTSGYCKAIQLYFVFTHEKSVYAIVKDFYLCEHHALENEDLLKKESQEVDLAPYLEKRNLEKKL
jgi:hypothetical protein